MIDLIWVFFYSGPPRSDGERRSGDRDGYRGGQRSGGEFGDKSGAPADYQPSFRVPFLFKFSFPFVLGSCFKSCCQLRNFPRLCFSNTLQLSLAQNHFVKFVVKLLISVCKFFILAMYVFLFCYSIC